MPLHIEQVLINIFRPVSVKGTNRSSYINCVMISNKDGAMNNLKMSSQLFDKGSGQKND